METMSRRDFIARSLTVAGGASLLGLPTLATAQPAMTKAGRIPPGQQQVMPLPYPTDAVRGMSAEQLGWHHDRHYSAYVKNRNEIEQQLAGMDPAAPGFDAKLYGGLKRQLGFNVCGQILHECFFTVLGGDGQFAAGSPIAAAIQRDFGGPEKWQADLRATATAAGVGWGVTCYDPSAGRLVNYLVELHQLGAVWTAIPIIALDGWEHAYYHDFGPDKNKYFDVFFQNLNWGRIGQLYQGAVG